MIFQFGSYAKINIKLRFLSITLSEFKLSLVVRVLPIVTVFQPIRNILQQNGTSSKMECILEMFLGYGYMLNSKDSKRSQAACKHHK